MTESQATASPAPLADGLQTRIRAALKDVADDVASRNTRTVIAVPGKEISAAMFEIFSDVPHTPDYTEEQAAGLQHFDSVTVYASDEIPPDPFRVSVNVDEQDDNAGDPKVVLTVDDGQQVTRVPFTPEVAERLFLAGLAACNYARPLSRYAPSVD